jgi:hypothetical protein
MVARCAFSSSTNFTQLAHAIESKMRGKGVDLSVIETNLEYQCASEDSIHQFVEPGTYIISNLPNLIIAAESINLLTLWRAVSFLQNTTNAAPALRLGLINILELIWGIEDQESAK